MMFQLRDQEAPESRAGRLARDRDHHAQVIKKMSKMMTLLMTMFIILKLKIVYVGKVCRLQARDQEEEEERIARLARKRDHQAQVIKKSFKDDDVADVFCKHMMTMLILPRSCQDGR